MHLQQNVAGSYLAFSLAALGLAAHTLAMMMDEEFWDLTCPYCTRTVSFPNTMAGTAQQCPECYESLIVPHQAQAAAEKVPVPINTHRLILRRLAMGDWKDVLEISPDYSPEDGHSEQQILQWLEGDQHVKLTTPNASFFLGMQLQDQDKLIGKVELTFRDHTPGQATLNIDVSPKFQRQGFGTEAINALLDFCFSAIGLHRVIAYIDSRNTPGLRLAEKTGLRREGEALEDRWADGVWANTVSYALLDHEYRKARSSGPNL